MTSITVQHDVVVEVTDVDYYPLPEENNMEKPLPRIPDLPDTPLDRAIAILERSRGLYDRIAKHQAEKRAEIEALPGLKLNPNETGKTNARDFVPVSPIADWLDVTDESVHLLTPLEQAGLIATVKVQQRWYARTAP